MNAAAAAGEVKDSYPYWLRPAAPTDLVCVGSAGDGGYVPPRRIIDEVQGVLGMGLFDDWSFEKWIYERTGANVAIFDHTVDLRFWLRRTAANLVRGVLQDNIERLKKLTIPFCILAVLLRPKAPPFQDRYWQHPRHGRTITGDDACWYDQKYSAESRY